MSDSASLFLHSFYLGNAFLFILYGVELVFYFATLWIALQKHERRKTSNFVFVFFSTFLLVLVTIEVATEGVFGELMWITDANFPGGAEGFLGANVNVWYQTLGSAASLVLTVCSDWLLIWRCYVIWNNWRVIIFPSILGLASTVVGVLVCFYSSRPDADFFAGLSAKLEIGFRSLVLAINFLVTFLICGRIMYVSKEVKQSLGKEAARPYTSIVAMIVESALPYTVVGIMYIISFGLNSPLSILFLSIYAMASCISPQMIMLRVLLGQGWTRDTATRSAGGPRAGGTMQFATPTHSMTDYTTSSGPTMTTYLSIGKEKTVGITTETLV
ncbi:hypothetical protein PHLGIDRAFT_125731 [Phlebiopsis gigantea 11061_1 CR5-6]|uniref:Uncharacterized protein n=1 Tax=Phlebiopsis gigantea (strain 11061_1 CR5-6) TaxID=745531 RepID=A0A0C3PSB1_PHLG1|nr:hypothetical protein PHLGIDRAFT_125731 [Phlebiopsis gigantea 11061_1 CR5-6]